MVTVAFKGREEKADSEEGAQEEPLALLRHSEWLYSCPALFLKRSTWCLPCTLGWWRRMAGLRAAIQVMPAQESARGSTLRRSVCEWGAESPPPHLPEEGLAFPTSRKDLWLLTGALRQFGCGPDQPGSGQRQTLGAGEHSARPCRVRMPGP